MCHQAQLHTQRCGPTFKFGILLPYDRNDALQIDEDNGNQLWRLSIGTEMEQIDEYDTFRNMGRGVKPPRENQRIRVHIVFDVKHDLRRKARLVAGGHMTSPSKDSVYSGGVVTLRSLRLTDLTLMQLMWAIPISWLTLRKSSTSLLDLNLVTDKVVYSSSSRLSMDFEPVELVGIILCRYTHGHGILPTQG